MTTLQLRNGFKIPLMGYGTFNCQDEKQFEAALEEALETGYRHIDTALLYNNEHVIGRVLQKWFSSGKLKREDLFVTTKLPGCLPPEQVEPTIKKSLQALQLDYVDLYLIHSPLNILFEAASSFADMKLGPSDLVATWKKMEEQVDLKRAKAIGVSNFNKDQVRRILENCKVVPAANQVELHVYLQQPELVKYCNGNGIVVISYQSLGNPGLPDWYAKNKIITSHQPYDLLHDSTILDIASKHQKTSAQILLKFLVQNNIPVIPKSLTPSRIKENFNISDFTLDSFDMQRLKHLDKGDDGRITWFDFNTGFVSSPEYPFARKTVL